MIRIRAAKFTFVKLKDLPKELRKDAQKMKVSVNRLADERSKIYYGVFYVENGVPNVHVMDEEDLKDYRKYYDLKIFHKAG